MKFLGKIKEGRLEPMDKQSLSRFIKSHEGFWFELSIGLKGRSIPQNKYYWGVIVKSVADETGHSVNDVHDFFKTKFLSRKVSIGGSEQTITGSTSELDVAEFEEYAEKCRRFAGEVLGLIIPLPNEEGI